MPGMHPGPAVKRLRAERGWKLEELATRLENQLGKPVNTGNLSRLEREKQGYSNDLIQALARAFGVEVAELFEGPPRVPTPKTTATRMRHPPGTHIQVGQVVTELTGVSVSPEIYSIPVLEIEASMGVGTIEPEFETVIGKIDLNREYVTRNFPSISSPGNIRILTGRGNSMWDPERRVGFQDGDLLFVDIGVTDVKTESAYVFSQNGDLYVKGLQRLPNGTLRVISYNRSYEPYVIEERESVRIIARVVASWNLAKL
jgi:transcriptional regulator with XRE-family HTH domain